MNDDEIIAHIRRRLADGSEEVTVRRIPAYAPGNPPKGGDVAWTRPLADVEILGRHPKPEPTEGDDDG
jgi:hypothetical protein